MLLHTVNTKNLCQKTCLKQDCLCQTLQEDTVLAEVNAEKEAIYQMFAQSHPKDNGVKLATDCGTKKTTITISGSEL
jgi:hypothetical protein